MDGSPQPSGVWTVPGRTHVSPQLVAALTGAAPRPARAPAVKPAERTTEPR
jgi:hypothetical protein